MYICNLTTAGENMQAARSEWHVTDITNTWMLGTYRYLDQLKMGNNRN